MQWAKGERAEACIARRMRTFAAGCAKSRVPLCVPACWLPTHTSCIVHVPDCPLCCICDVAFRRTHTGLSPGASTRPSSSAPTPSAPAPWPPPPSSLMLLLLLLLPFLRAASSGSGC